MKARTDAQWSDLGVPRPEVKNYMCFCHIIDSISPLGGGPPFIINFVSVLSLWITAPYFPRWCTCGRSGSDITIIYERNLSDFSTTIARHFGGRRRSVSTWLPAVCGLVWGSLMENIHNLQAHIFKILNFDWTRQFG